MLCENSSLKIMAEQIRAQSQNGGVLMTKESQDILCDVCTQQRQKALKSCLVCLTSYCECHLEPHQRVATLKIHKLIDPVAHLEDRICKKHQRLLELFCRSDEKCVCVLCTETDHHGHVTVPVERQSEEQKIQIKGRVADSHHMILEKLKKVDEIKHAVELSKINTARNVEECQEIFSTLLCSIKTACDELVQLVQKKQEAAERRAESLIAELEQDISDLERRTRELEVLLDTEDHLQVLQKYSSPSSPLPLNKWTEVFVYPDTCVGTVRRAVAHIEDLLQPPLKNFSIQEHEQMQQHAVDVQLDVSTANPWLVLSKDRTQVWVGDVEQNMPDSPEHFDTAPCVLATRGFTTGRHYWEVVVGDKTAWDLGVARQSVNRKGVVTLSTEDGYWAICLRRGSEYRACAGPSVTLCLAQKPQVVGVFLDYEEGSVSFYDVAARSHIYSFTKFDFTEAMFPLFNPEISDGDNNKSPLIIRPIICIKGNLSLDDITV